ncbi:MAG: cupin domain-containing protein [Bacteroidota bacterium]
MKYISLLLLIGLFFNWELKAQEKNPTIVKIDRALLAGEALDTIPQKQPDRVVYQSRVYDGNEIVIYMVAIGTGITNTFKGFPLEEFIFWMNGKALVEPVGEKPFEVQSGDYFIQAKGFTGNWNFIDNGGIHLELALVAKNRIPESDNSPITKAMIIDKDLISGISTENKEGRNTIYEGVELIVNIVGFKNWKIRSIKKERMIHLLNGVVTITGEDQKPAKYYPGDFLIIPEGFSGTWQNVGQQAVRAIEVYRAY